MHMSKYWTYYIAKETKLQEFFSLSPCLLSFSLCTELPTSVLEANWHDLHCFLHWFLCVLLSAPRKVVSMGLSTLT